METMDQPKARLWTKDFLFLAFSNLFLFFSFQMLIPTLPFYVTQKGGDESAVGLVIGIFTISALITRPFAGNLLNRSDRGKLLLVGLGIFLLSVIGYYWMAAVFLILLLRIVHGVGWGITTTALGTIVADVIPASRRGEGMGYYGLSNSLAMALAPMIGIWVMKEYGFGILFAASAVLCGLSMLMTRGVTYPTQAPAHAATSAKEKQSTFWSGLYERTALFPSLLLMLMAVVYGGIVSFITLFGQEVGIANVGWFFFANAVMLMMVRPFSGRLFDRKGHAAVLLPGAVFTFIGLVMLSYATSELSLMLAAVLFGIGFGMTTPSLQAWTIQRSAPHRRGTATGTFFSANDLGIGAGAMIFGLVAQFTSFAMLYRLSSGVILVYLVLYTIYLARVKKEQRRVQNKALSM